MRNLNYVCRQLLKNPGFTTVAVLTLGLGIGATTAILSVAYAVLLRPLPFPEANRLVQVLKKWHPPSSRQEVVTPAFSQRDFPAKWISRDGRAAWLVFSGGDAFSIRKASFVVKANGSEEK